MKGGVEKKEIKIFLFRHGKTEANEKHLYCGKTDLPLSEKGRAELLEKKENCLYPDITHCKIFTSGLKRTTQSLGILYPEIISPEKNCVPATSSEGSSFENDRFSEIAIEPSFREIDFGDFEMKSYEELKANPEYQKWLNGEAERFEREKRENGREERGIEQNFTQNQVDRI